MVGQNGQIGGLVLRALAHERPAVALASLHPAPRTVALLSQLFVVALRQCFAGHDTREVTAVRDRPVISPIAARVISRSSLIRA